ncbi:MAG TPA: hypothetical protein VHF92_07620, partial [Geodermatophilus sp.]|nr:hypothetical protein [Geodermatophilus sp.]
PLVGPLLIACLPAVRDWGAVPRWRLGLRVVAGAGAVFALFSALSRLGFLPADQADVVNHEKAFLVVLAVAAALAARDLRLVLVAAGAAVFAFATYPAATYLVAAAAAVGTVVLARWSPGATARVWLAAASMAATAWAVLRIDDLLALAGTYFELVGKTNNSGTRRALYEEALQGLENPLVGSLFTGDITVVGTLSGQDRVVPVHNDYLSITLGGGLLAAALLLGLFLYANGLALRSLREMTDPEQRRTVIALLSGVNAAAVSAFANPIFMNPGASALAYAMLAALVAACRVPAAAPPDDGR